MSALRETIFLIVCAPSSPDLNNIAQITTCKARSGGRRETHLSKVN